MPSLKSCVCSLTKREVGSEGLTNRIERSSFRAGNRPCGTSILYLLKKGEVSRLHYLRSDETWYFHSGNPLELHSFSDGEYESAKLGCRLTIGEVPQVTLPAGTVFGANPTGNEEWSLVSCSVSPGFDDADFFWPDLEQLARDFSAQETVLRKLAPFS